MWRQLFGLLIFASYLVIGGTFIHDIKDTDRPQETEVLSAVSNYQYVPQAGQLSAYDVFSAVNEERAARGLEPLVASFELTKVAEKRAEDMRDRGYFDHKSPEGQYYSDIMESMDVRSRYSCENLDLNFGINPRPYVHDWLNSSSGHKSCMLHPSAIYAGFAVVQLNEQKTQDTAEKTHIVVAIHATD
jgi:uncharacterized protein YkwD